MTFLQPPFSPASSIKAATTQLCADSLDSSSSLKIELQTEIEEKDIPENLRDEIIKLIRGPLPAIIKYGQGELVQISFVKDDNYLRFEVADNGAGLNSPQPMLGKTYLRGLALSRMKSRVEMSGGTFYLVTAMENGTGAIAEWPLSAR